MTFCDSTDMRLASFLLQRLSYLIGWEVKDWNCFNEIEVLFSGSFAKWPYAHLFAFVADFCFQLCIIITVDFTLIPTFTFALLWKWTCWRCYRACELWNCRLEVPSTPEYNFLAYISILCLSEYKAE